jgi:hypothetical protein
MYSTPVNYSRVNHLHVYIIDYSLESSSNRVPRIYSKQATVLKAPQYAPVSRHHECDY